MVVHLSLKQIVRLMFKERSSSPHTCNLRVALIFDRILAPIPDQYRGGHYLNLLTISRVAKLHPLLPCVDTVA